MEPRKFKDNEVEDIEGLIPSIEKMFHIKFESEELTSVSNFDELCNAIIEKIQLTDVDSCTKQQAFYKLRMILEKTGITNRQTVKINSDLEKILPRKTRKKQLKQIEKELGFKINLIEPPKILVKIILIGFLMSFISLFIFFNFGIIGIIISILSLWIAKIFGNELKVETIKEFVEFVVRNNYLDIRSAKGTINRKELKIIIIDWFSENLGMDKTELLNARFL